jgi:branched-chain amino acid transport system substrate-binding protein
MTSKIAAVLAAGLMGAASFAHAAEPPKDPETFEIGAILAMTGSAPYYGEVMSRGIKLAVKEINDAGGIGGIKLNVTIEDHKSGKAKEGVAGMQRLLSLHNTQAVLSSFSAPTLAIAPIADREKIFVINGGGVSAKLIKASKYMVHNRQLSSSLASAVADLGKERGYKKMAIIHWKDAAGDSVRDVLTEEWTGDGRKVVAAEAVVQGAANIDTQVAKIRASRPDVVALGVFQPEVGLAIKRLRELGVKVPIIGIEWTEEDAKIAGKHAEGYEYMLEVFKPTAENPWSQQFARAYKDTYDQEPDIFSGNYYEATYVIAELIKRARAKGGDYWNGEKLHEALWDNPTFKSVYGKTMVFDPKTGLAQKPLAQFKVDAGGKGQFVKYVEKSK